MGLNITSIATQQGGLANYNYADEIYEIRLNDPKEGLVIPAACIESLEIDENMFSLLPTFKLHIIDKGAYFTGFNVKIGDSIFFKITPNITDESEEPTPYINAEYCIQSINCLPDVANGIYDYTFVGIYNAQSYLNEIFTYPKTTETSFIQRDNKTSDEAIREVLDDTTLKLVTHCEPTDNSLWINCNDTRSKFVDKIIDHAWIDINDAPLLYTDLNGQTHYTSIKTLSEQKKLANFENSKYYVDKLNPDVSTDLTMLYGDVNFLNAGGPILNQGGYTIKESYYTPYNLPGIVDTDIELADINFSDMIEDLLVTVDDVSTSDLVTSQLMDGLTKGKYRIATYSQDEPYLASRSNKTPSQMNKITNNLYAGIHFKDYHNHYDLAPKHNEMIRRSFFQNFANMLVDVHRLPNEFRNNICRPVLGDKIYVDFSNSEGIDKIHSGNYIICGIKHCFNKYNAYTMQMKVVTDGTFGKGSLEQ